MKAADVDGILVIDKPPGMTSRAVVDRAGRWFPAGTRLGHAGTLDPLATGVLAVCAGRATRLIEYIQHMAKDYQADLLLGAESDTDDADGQVQPLAVSRPPGSEEVAACLGQFIGTIEQAPPRYSAAHVAGRRAYDLARAGREFELKPRRVEIHNIELLGYSYPHLALNVRCSKGTYMRSLARDLGKRLGCGALIQGLRRTRIGRLTLENAVTLEMDAASAQSRLLPVAAAVAQLPQVVLRPELVRRLCQGQVVSMEARPSQSAPQEHVAIVDETGALRAIAIVDGDRRLRPARVLSAEK
jgi:tRNA pseudouridine55 synthase